MGGRGSISFTYTDHRSKDGAIYIRKPVARLNTGGGGGASVEVTIEKFRKAYKNDDFMHSAYVDEFGFAHALGTSMQSTYTTVTPLKSIKTASNPMAIVLNQPARINDTFGGSFSSASLNYLGISHGLSSGKTREMYLTAPEGTYKARIRGHKAPSQEDISGAHNKAKSLTTERKYYSKRSMWKSYNKNLTDEMDKIGIDITFNPDKSFNNRKK